MHQVPPRHPGFNSRPLRSPERFSARPDRLALWAVVMAVVAMCAAAGTARAADGGSGGVAIAAPGGGGIGSTGPAAGSCQDIPLGERDLSRGDCGTDVLILNWVLNSKEFGITAELNEDFDAATEDAVDSLQEVAELPRTGVVDAETRAALIRSMRWDEVSWFGPGLYGNTMACGDNLTRTTVGVAHKTLPCGTKVVLKYKGRYLRTEVVDRGPYIKGRRWDLTSAAQQRLRTPDVARVRSAIVREDAP